jgi:hypothetical protein
MSSGVTTCDAADMNLLDGSMRPEAEKIDTKLSEMRSGV